VLGATVTSASARDGTVLEALLEIADSGITYRRRYRASLQPAPVVDLLLADASNPRSAAFQLAALGEHLAVLPQDQTRIEPHVAWTEIGSERSPSKGSTGTTPGSPCEIATEVLRAAVAAVQATDLTAACAADAEGRRPALAALLGRLARELPTISDALSGSYLTHASLARQLAERTRDVVWSWP
jgi:uncharacterized alpha-E superfamily protein